MIEIPVDGERRRGERKRRRERGAILLSCVLPKSCYFSAHAREAGIQFLLWSRFRGYERFGSL